MTLRAGQKILVAQSPALRLSEASRQSWKDQGGVILVPRVASWMAHRIAEYNVREYPIAVNMGNPWLNESDLREYGWSGDLVNSGEDIRWTYHPAQNYAKLGDLMGMVGEDALDGPHWIKGPGHGGRNKFLCSEADCDHVVGDTSIIQAEYSGHEYRVNTFGDTVFQVQQRFTHPDGGRYYEWVGVEAMNQTGLIPFIKKALARVYEHDLGGVTPSVLLGWDVMNVGDYWVVLEANSAPGMNTHTVNRFRKLLEMQHA